MGKGEGKGRGRGGCGALEAAGDCVQCIAITICLICIAGPVLTIFGIAFISSAVTNDRAEKIDEFKVSVGNWMDGAVDGFASTQADWSYSIANSCGGGGNGTNDIPGSLTLSSSLEDLGREEDEKEDFASYKVVFFEDKSPPAAAQTLTGQQTSCNLEISILYKGAVVGNITEPVVTEENIRFQQMCTETRQQTDSGRRQDFTRQDINRCEQQCRSRGGESSGQSYNNFNCKVLESPTGACIRVKKAGNSWTEATTALPGRESGGATGKGCFLPFSFASLSQNSPGGRWMDVTKSAVKPGAGALQLPVSVRSENDPYLYFLDISDGFKSFGLTRGEKLRIGFSLLAIGLLLTTCVCCCCCTIAKFAWGFASGKSNRPDNAVGGAMYDVAGKYGNYIPGGAALGQPVPGQTVAGIPHPGGKPPAGYPGGGAGYGGPQKYDGNTSYDSPNVQYGAHGGGGGQYAPNPQAAMQYGSATPSYATGGNTGAPPPGYPTAV